MTMLDAIFLCLGLFIGWLVTSAILLAAFVRAAALDSGMDREQMCTDIDSKGEPK